MKHWTFGGSTAQRTLNCPGWVNRSEGIPKGPPSEAAIRGTALHDCMEQILSQDEDPTYEYLLTFLGVVDVEGQAYDITEDDVNDALVPAWNAFDDLCEQYDIAEWVPEVSHEYAPDSGGSADVLALSRDNKTLVVVDWKFGKGIQVFPDENAQAMFYAGILTEDDSPVADMITADLERVVLAIIQPNDRDNPVLRTWETDLGTLADFMDEWDEALERARKPDAPLEAGKWCRFCPAASVCEARRGVALSALQMDPKDLNQLASNLELCDDLRAWIRDVESEAHKQLKAGNTIEGYKLVMKRAQRLWATDEDTIFKKFSRKLGGKKNMVKTSLLSPAQIEKLAKERGVDLDLDEYIIKRSSGTAVAHEDDKRPAVPGAEAVASALKAIAK